jgi:predicted PolB exonuclease-like 3'-5' exonuclease
MVDEKSDVWFRPSKLQGGLPCRLFYTPVDPFPPPQAQRVVAIAWCDVEMIPDEFKTYRYKGSMSAARWSDDSSAEKYLISLFGATQSSISATLVTWNGRTFDLPVLAMRALHLGIPWEWYYKSSDIRYRYSDKGHNDLMDFLSDFGAARSMKLSDACHLVGLPGKTDMDGSQVAGLVARDPECKSCATISRYCLQDALQTALLFVRTRYHLGIINRDEYHASLATFAAGLGDALTVDWEKCRIS